MTGLIYVAIIAVWAIVLVPAWLRRHDHLDPERSVDRFTRSMQTLASRPSVLGIPMPGGQVGAEQPHDHDTVEPEVLTVTRPELGRLSERVGGAAARANGLIGQAGSRVRSTSAASRRRVVLAVLTGVLALTTALVVVGALAPIALVLPTGLLLGFVGLARHQVAAARRRRTAPPVRSAVPIRTVREAAPAARPAPGASGSTWEARSTPLPSYVTAPPAAGFPRVIDTETPGAWTAAAMLAQAQQEKDRADRMARAKAEAIARARAEQAAAESRSRDEEYFAAEQAMWQQRRRAVNE